MPQPVNYICTKCDFRDSSFSTWGHYSYSVHDKLIPINRSIAICYTCESIVSAEILPSKERIHSLKNKTSDYLKQRFPGTESLRIKRTLEEEARFEILQDRTSPARCLACGSHDFELIPEVVPDIKRKKSGLPIRTGLFHRHCGGRIYADFRSMNFFMGDRLPHKVYDIEGIQIKSNE